MWAAPCGVVHPELVPDAHHVTAALAGVGGLGGEVFNRHLGRVGGGRELNLRPGDRPVRRPADGVGVVDEILVMLEGPEAQVPEEDGGPVACGDERISDQGVLVVNARFVAIRAAGQH
jgi:hypothetical protein